MDQLPEVEAYVEQSQECRISRIWLDPDASIHPGAAAAIPEFEAVAIGPGDF